MENSSLVSKVITNVNQSASTSTQGEMPASVTTQQDTIPSIMSETSTDGMPFIRSRLQQQNISQRACDIIMASWRTGTTKQYRVYLDKWGAFAIQRNENPVANVIEFLTRLYDSGSSYSAINTAWSALSATVELADSPHSVGEHPLVRRFVRATYQSRPPLPRYQTIWDVSKVLNFLKTWSPVNKLSLKLLTLKLVMLGMGQAIK